MNLLKIMTSLKPDTPWLTMLQAFSHAQALTAPYKRHKQLWTNLTQLFQTTIDILQHDEDNLRSADAHERLDEILVEALSKEADIITAFNNNTLTPQESAHKPDPQLISPCYHPPTQDIRHGTHTIPLRISATVYGFDSVVQNIPVPRPRKSATSLNLPGAPSPQLRFPRGRLTAAEIVAFCPEWMASWDVMDRFAFNGATTQVLAEMVMRYREQGEFKASANTVSRLFTRIGEPRGGEGGDGEGEREGEKEGEKGGQKEEQKTPDEDIDVDAEKDNTTEPKGKTKLKRKTQSRLHHHAKHNTPKNWDPKNLDVRTFTPSPLPPHPNPNANDMPTTTPAPTHGIQFHDLLHGVTTIPSDRDALDLTRCVTWHRDNKEQDWLFPDQFEELVGQLAKSKGVLVATDGNSDGEIFRRVKEEMDDKKRFKETEKGKGKGKEWDGGGDGEDSGGVSGVYSLQAINEAVGFRGRGTRGRGA
ncbi:hypothetical protein P280DRAFT_473780 [Massarina eburnea CBS 473.64]|uniref:Uncharacterized protein n=1 Tax=Massarina eburnea CBS 473.64 TaxID=1395130 RepID=A0A6A6RLX6_9PLEO|nr:hypothetical protein P280DRAFT_473780 [Massarina eburnea CBS 473.64]